MGATSAALRLILVGLLAIFGRAAIAETANSDSAEPEEVQIAQAGSAALAAPRAAWAGGIPLLFEPNLGQSDPRVRFLSRGPGFGLFLTDNEAVLALPGDKPFAARHGLRQPASPVPKSTAVLRLAFVGAQPAPKIAGEERQKALVHHHVGNDRSKWRTGIPTFRSVVYRDLYPGIDLAFSGGRGGPRYDFTVAPNADARVIRLGFPNAERLSLDAKGALIVRVAGRDIRHSAPVLYQEFGGRRELISGRFELRSRNQVGFRVGAYDRSRPLTIDPTLDFATVIGGGNYENTGGLAVQSGNVFVAGYSFSADLPASASALTGIWDAYVAKLSGSDGSLVYSTYVGGQGDDYAQALVVDGQGRAHIAGFSEVRAGMQSPDDFPVTTQRPYGGGTSDAFVVRLSASGQLDFGTFLGGFGPDRATALALDSTGIYVGGWTQSDNFPTAGQPAPVQTTAHLQDGFVTKLSLDGASILFSTRIGGSGYEEVTGIAVNGAGEAHVVGWTSSVNDFPTCIPPGPTTCISSGHTEIAQAIIEPKAFAAKLNANGSALVYSTLLGGYGYDIAYAVVIDPTSDSAIVVGSTTAADFPTRQAFQDTRVGFGDGFLTKLGSDGRIVFSTFIGGTSVFTTEGFREEAIFSVALDPNDGQIWIAGFTSSRVAELPANYPAENDTGGYHDGFLARVAADGSRLGYWRFIGGSATDLAYNVVVAPVAGGSSDIYVAGYLQPSAAYNFPIGLTLGPRGGQSDIFVAKFTAAAPVLPVVSVTAMATPDPIYVGDTVRLTVTVRNDGTVPATAVQLTEILDGQGVFTISTWDAPPCSPTPGGTPQASVTFTCGIGSAVPGTLGPGESMAIHATGQAINPGTAISTSLVNLAGASPVSTSLQLHVLSRGTPLPLLSIETTVTPDPVIAGRDMTLTVRTTNSGTVPLTGLRIADQFSGGTAARIANWTPASCAGTAGATVTLDCPTLGSVPTRLVPGEVATVTLTGPAVAAGSFSNIATASAAEAATVFSAFNRTVQLGRADLAVGLQIFNPPAVGVNLSPLVILTNAGPDPASTVEIKVTVAGAATVAAPVGPGVNPCQAMAVAVGQPQVMTCIFPGPFDINPATSAGSTTAFGFNVTPTAGGMLSVCAEIVASSAGDDHPENNRQCQDIAVPVPVTDPPRPQIAITNTYSAAPHPVRIGDVVDQKIGISNTGNVPLTSARFEITLNFDTKVFVLDGHSADPDISCTWPARLNGPRVTASCSVTGTLSPGRGRGVRLLGHAIGRGNVTSTVIARAEETGPIWLISPGGFTVRATENADLQVGISSPPSATLNQPMTAYVNLANAGPAHASSIQVTIGLSGISGSAVTYPLDKCGLNPAMVLSCTVASLPNGQQTTVPLVFLIASPTQLGIDARVESQATEDPVPQNNHRSRTTSFQ